MKKRKAPRARKAVKHDLQKAYSSLWYSYACLELDMLEAISILRHQSDNPRVQALVIRYAERIVRDSNFLMAMRSGAVTDRKLARLRAPFATKEHGEQRWHEAIAQMLKFLHGGPLGFEEVLDFNLLQHEPKSPSTIGLDKPVPVEIRFDDSVLEKAQAQAEKMAAKLKKSQAKQKPIPNKYKEFPRGTRFMRIRTDNGIEILPIPVPGSAPIREKP